MASQRYLQLKLHLANLRQHLLPAEFSETGVYENEATVSVRTISYRVLAHAELEAYFEDRVIEVAKSSLQQWKDRGHTSRALLSLLAFSGREMRRPPESLTPPTENKAKAWAASVDIGERLVEAVSDFIRAVTKENHGIREKNLLSMLLPVGVPHTLLDPTIIADFDSFGVRRGEAAHTSTVIHVRHAANPADEEALVIRLVDAVEPLDRFLDEILAEGAQ